MTANPEAPVIRRLKIFWKRLTCKHKNVTWCMRYRFCNDCYKETYFE